MISEFQVLVAHFNKGVGQRLHENGLDLPRMIDLRVALIEEEVKETLAAIQEKDPIGVIDGLCDVLYVTYGAADVFDLELDWLEEKRSPVEKCDWERLNKMIEHFSKQASLAVLAIKAYDPEHCLDLIERLQWLVDACWFMGTQGLGVDLRPFFREVHRTNMWKLKGPKREDGKQLKPEGWKPPRLEAMYNRLKAGNPPHCVYAPPHTYPHDTRYLHPGGGEFCAACGGLLINVEEM